MWQRGLKARSNEASGADGRLIVHQWLMSALQENFRKYAVLFVMLIDTSARTTNDRELIKRTATTINVYKHIMRVASFSSLCIMGSAGSVFGCKNNPACSSRESSAAEKRVSSSTTTGIKCRSKRWIMCKYERFVEFIRVSIPIFI